MLMNQRIFSFIINAAAFLVRVAAGFLIGWILWRIHPVIAIAGGILIFGFFANILIWLGGLFSKPMGNPTCRNGKCKTADYKYIGWIGNYLHKQCSCGDDYLLTPDRFLSLDGDGIARPYMIYKNKKEGWVLDTSKETIDTNEIKKEFERQRTKRKEKE